MLYQVSVRWWDDYLEEFAATEVRLSVDLLYLVLTIEQGKAPRNRHIPLCQVRWFSIYPPTQESGPCALRRTP
jgi:hypothetical protein